MTRKFIDYLEQERRKAAAPDARVAADDAADAAPSARPAEAAPLRAGFSDRGYGTARAALDVDEDDRQGGGLFSAFLFLLILALIAAGGYGGYRGKLRLDDMQADLDRLQAAGGGGAFPAGAIVAFSRDSRARDAACPAGWTGFDAASGRAIIGAGAGSGLTPRRAGETGGAEGVALTIENLPPHAHGVTVFRAPSLAPMQNGQQMDRFIGGAGAGADGKFLEMRTGEAGAGAAIGLMPPYLALQYCRKN